MRGEVIKYDDERGAGEISGDDANWYLFTNGEWTDPSTPREGMVVHFTPDDGLATRVYPAAAYFDWEWFLLSFEGRIPRSWFWLRFNVPVLVLSLLLAYINWSGIHVGLLERLFNLAIIWPSIAVAVKRCHDRNKSGWWLLVSLIPLIGLLWWLIELGMLRGTYGRNRFGMDKALGG